MVFLIFSSVTDSADPTHDRPFLGHDKPWIGLRLCPRGASPSFPLLACLPVDNALRNLSHAETDHDLDHRPSLNSLDLSG